MKRDTLKKIAVIPVICSMLMTACGAGNSENTASPATNAAIKEGGASADAEAPAATRAETAAAAATEAAEPKASPAVEEAAPATEAAAAHAMKAKADAEYDKFKERTQNELTPVEMHFIEQFEKEQKKLGKVKK